ncbi:MAG: hypothetical protein U1F67_01895 [Rubrivivax sp.]
MAPQAAEATGRALPPSGDVDHLRALFVQTPATLIGYLLGAAVITWLFWPLAPAAQMLGWLAAVAVLWLARLAHYLRFRRNPSADERSSAGARAGGRWCCCKAASGASPAGCSGAWARLTSGWR